MSWQSMLNYYHAVVHRGSYGETVIPVRSTVQVRPTRTVCPVPFTPHEKLLAQVAEARQQQAGANTSANGWAVTYRGDGKTRYLYFSIEEAPDVRAVMAKLYARQITMERIKSLDRVGVKEK